MNDYMDIKITVINHFTKETIIDSVVTVPDNWEIVEANHKAYSEMMPDCYVNFYADKDNFIFGMPLNQKTDDEAYNNGLISWKQYCDKWYNGSESGCNEDDEVERQIDDLLEADWNERDSVCF